MRTKLLSATLALLLSVIFCFGCANTRPAGLLRVHIRANSNSQQDQAVKLDVRDAVVQMLTPVLADCRTLEQAYAVLESRLRDVERTAQAVLAQKGHNYGARARLANEYFPVRQYEGFVVESGYYDALIVELGQARGDNWWCVVYPPLCFVQRDEYGSQVEYRSFLAEMWRKVFG